MSERQIQSMTLTELKELFRSRVRMFDYAMKEAQSHLQAAETIINQLEETANASANANKPRQS